MKLNEYQKNARRTCPDLGSLEANFQHFRLGVFTEVGEFLDPIKKFKAYGKPIDYTNLGEELGDTGWYLANKAILLEEEFPEEFLESAEKCISLDDAVIHIEVFLTSILESNETTLLQISRLKPIADFLGFDFYQLLDNNIGKLKIRFPEKFCAEKAQNRNLEAERAELEK